MNETKTYYSSRAWLNKPESPSTGNVAAYHGLLPDGDKYFESIFISVSDCHVSARLHKSESDSKEDFIDKLKLLKNEIDCFIKHLENNTKNVAFIK